MIKMEFFDKEAQKILDLRDNMVKAFSDSSPEELLKIAIIAGLKDAYDQGFADASSTLESI